MSFISLKDYIYIGAMVALVALGLYLRQHLINEGEAKAQAREARAAQKQKAEDDTLAQGVTSDLNNEIARLRATQLPPTHVRLCPAARSVPAADTSLGTAIAITPASGGVPDVSGGTPANGEDVGPLLQQFAVAADIVSARGRACLEWAKGLR